TYSGEGYKYSSSYNSCIFYQGSDDLTISLKGKNVITQTKDPAYNSDFAFLSDKNNTSVTITGSGSLEMKLEDTWAGASLKCGGKLIVSSGSLIVEGGYNCIRASEVIIKKGVTAFEAKCCRDSTKVISDKLINEIPGIGYDQWDRTTDIPVDTTGKQVGYKSVRFPVKPKTFTVVFDPGEGTGSMDPVTVTENENYLLPECGFEAPEGKIFSSWNIDGVDLVGIPGNTEPMVSHIAKNGVITFIAHYREAPAAVVETAPKGNDSTYKGSAIELVTAGKALGGSMQYALGTDAKTAPASGWSKEIPTVTDAGTYYVWYMAAGEKDRSNSKKVCVTVTIAKKDVAVKAIDQTIKETESPELTSDNAVLTGAVSGHSMTAVTITEKDGKLIPSAATIKDSKNNDVTNNYKITYEQGALTVLHKISCKVTFNVANGEWDNGGSDEIKVELTGFEGDTLKLQPDQIPGVGTKPAANYKQGAWDVTPDTETGITKDTAYVYTYTEAPVYTITVDGDNFTPGSGKNIVFTVKRNIADDTTYSRFESFTVDGNSVSDKYFEKVPGSLILTVKSEFLDTLSAGSHNIKITFTDGEAQVAVTILKAQSNTKPTSVPQTGEGANPFIWLIIPLIGLLVLLVKVLVPKSPRRKIRPVNINPDEIMKKDE
ncbi:MAG: hypothetical protein IKS98_05745, partial [Lachnospiraceae bacterium]|nr:hypothetical protein [Lachnospiraceae bacterium]